MVFQNISLNLSAFNNLEPLNISVNASGLNDVVSVANSNSSNSIIFFSLLSFFIIIYVALSDKTPLQDFGYGDLRALNIALAVCVLMGLTIVSVGWSPNFKAVGIFITAWLLSFIIILIVENKE